MTGDVFRAELDLMRRRLAYLKLKKRDNDIDIEELEFEIQKLERAEKYL